MIIRKATTEDRQRIREMSAICFEYPLRPEPAEAPPEKENFIRWVAATDDGKDIMSAATVNDFQVQFDGHSCRMGGIGGVTTLPQYRRCGCIRACFGAALADMYAEGYDFSYLYPFSTAYYRQFGYESCIQKQFLTVQLSTLKADAVDGAFRMADRRNPMTEAIRAVDRQWEQEYNMMVQHSEDHYDWTKNLDPAASLEYTYVYFAADGTPKGYTTFKPERLPEGRDYNCSRFYFTDKEGFNGLLQIFCSLSADHRAVKFMLPNVPAMQHLLRELALESVECNVKTIGMARVINAKSALEKAKYRGSGHIVLSIRDPQIAQNNRTFAVTFAGGRAVTVEETATAPDAVLDIPAFSVLMMGTADFDDAARWLNGITVKNENACFSQVFYSKKMLIVDFF